MKPQLQALLEQSLQALKQSGALNEGHHVEAQLTRTRDKAHGDFATNLAMQLAKPMGSRPRDVAQTLIDHLPESPLVEKVEIAGPGFINLFISQAARLAVITQVLESGEDYGRSHLGEGKRVQVEFVSANPTGPLHVGHGRGAAYGAAVADLLETVGFDVHREYYVNDAGRQMDILASSVWLRYLERCGVDFHFPANGYKGDYVRDIADTLFQEHGKDYAISAEALMSGLPADEPDGGDKEIFIDAIIRRAQEALGENRYRYVFELGLNSILDDIRDDLGEFGVHYDTWYSERSLTEKGSVNRALDILRNHGQVYEKDGALWFRSTEYGDEKDRVVQRDNGQTTYFASDIAYHMEKFERGYDRVIDVWGADHHGYVPRVKAALQALGQDDARLDVLLVQFAILYRSGERVQMSTRSGSFVTLRELRDEVGKDAARFFYVMRRCEQHLDFDLDLAKSESADNPVYYIQYAHARVCSVLRQMQAKGLSHDLANGQSHLARLTEDHEAALLGSLAHYPELVESAALAEEPHQVANYLRDLANDFHTYYNAHQFLVDDADLRDARLNLILAVRHVLANGLKLLGVSAPEEM
ncbi:MULTISPECIES: arginine--tRNA ligase [unclassified Ectothiorhodospira]|uniref:arginine--tRNA ligase n=1 Tax=unclassified Ectothiorhodospira TaxID=2684909 RepID=UPI001EE8B53C|nr:MULTISPECIES: arginine--tRNA ligase [unclassified Ectothiorhodospira]MCG5515339.1 arginine--tRNA ligase [Ectothiorhodospira sp. 9100]MCG5519217.1 arginine--tRNA ligase [Ectothiorhodospira sp. 9905]